MKKFLILVLAVVVIGSIYWLVGKPGGNTAVSPTPTATVAQSNQTVSDGTITVAYQPGQFGLATTPQQVLVTAYIPPCDPSFTYCLYYNGSAYKGTNFESAGLRIQKRTDITTKAMCVTLMPSGYTGLVPNTLNGPDYETSAFGPLGDAGAGHYSSGAEYRLWYNNSCYEFQTRIGETQYANYPAGTVKQFMDSDRANVQASLTAILNTVTLSNNEHVSFPQAPTTPAY